MKTLLLIAPLFLAACATPGMVPLDGAVGRSIERVVERHDVYVEADESLAQLDNEAYLSESIAAMSLLVMPEVLGETAAVMLDPIMNRHDAYVSADAELDELERAIYLESTERLRSLFASVLSVVLTR